MRKQMGRWLNERCPFSAVLLWGLVMIGYLLFISSVIVLSIVGYYSMPGATALAATKPSAAAADPLAQMSPSTQRGAQLFQTLGCIGCHKVHGQGGTVGPDLSSGVLKGKSRQWLIAQIRDPKKHDPKTIMPAFSSATAQQVSDIADYLLTLEPAKSSGREGTRLRQTNI
jgi:mono/diheme cytochrome c family protein